LLSLARSLLLAWSDPLTLLSSEASSLAHPERNTINSKTKELQDNINSLGAGLERVLHKASALLGTAHIDIVHVVCKRDDIWIKKEI